MKGILVRLLKIFRIQIFYHQRTKILYRVFPPKLVIEACPSLQDRIDSGENIIMLDGTVILDSNESIIGRGITTGLRLKDG